MRAHKTRVPFLLTFLLSLLLVACFGGHGGGGGGGGGNGGGGGGGGGNGGGGGGTTPGTVTIIEPTVSGAQVVAGSTLDFVAKVKGGNGMGVTWGVQSGDTCTNSNGVSNLGAVGGAGSVGTMPATTSNQAVATYTAPNVSALAGSAFITVTITALQSPATTGPCLVVYVLPTTNSLLGGRFAFRFRGFSSSGLTFGIIGRFGTDGGGNIANGFEDVNIAQSDGSSAAFTKVAFTGTYNMDTSSHGTMRLTITTPPPAWAALANPPPTTMDFSFTLSLDGLFGGLIETDGAATSAHVGSGDFQFQAKSSRFTTANIVGSYIMSLAGPAGFGANAVNKGFIGRVELAASGPLSGTIVSGVNSRGDDQSGALPNQALTGTYIIDDQTSGHGTLTITGTVNTTNILYTISFYIGYPKFFYALRTDNNVPSGSPDGILLGPVSFLPPTNPFDNTSLGSAAFELLGITDSHSANGQGRASAAVGVVVGGAQIQPPSTTNGFLQGIVDLNDGGTVPNGPISINSAPPNLGTFTIAPIGRGTISITLPGPTVPVTYNFVFYLNGRGGGFLLEQPASDGSNRGRSGSFFPQNVTSGGIGTFIASTDVATAKTENALAVLPLTFSGSSGIFQNGTEDVSKLGLAATLGASVSGTFTATDANNRGTATITSGSLAGSGTAAFYVASNTEVIVIGTDATNLEPQMILLTNSLPVNR